MRSPPGGALSARYRRSPASAVECSGTRRVLRKFVLRTWSPAGVGGEAAPRRPVVGRRGAPRGAPARGGEGGETQQGGPAVSEGEAHAAAKRHVRLRGRDQHDASPGHGWAIALSAATSTLAYCR